MLALTKGTVFCSVLDLLNPNYNQVSDVFPHISNKLSLLVAILGMRRQPVEGISLRFMS